MFLNIGVVSTLLHYALLILLKEQFNVNVIIASCSGYLLGGACNYLANYHFTFKSKSNHIPTLAKFVSVMAIGFLINLVLMKLMVEQFQFIYILAQVIATIGVLISNYCLHNYWTFKIDNN